MRTSDFVRGIEWQILAGYGHQPTGNKHIDCPVCGKKRHYRLHEHNGKPAWICTCGNGDMWSLLMETTGYDFATLAKEIDRDFGNTHEFKREPVSTKETKLSKAVRLFGEGGHLAGTHAQDYLNGRGIFSMPMGGVRLGSIHNKSCLVALASNEFSEPKVMHCTFLDGDKKAAGTARKMFSLVDNAQSVAIKLFEAGEVLGIAEGIESALSAFQLYKVATWSTMNATFMKKFRAPAGVKTLYIFADNDSNGTGLAAAFECGNRNVLANNDVAKVVIRWPQRLNDFNDHIQEGGEVVEWMLSK